MRCTDVRAALPLLIYGETTPRDDAIQAHLAQCAACRGEQEAMTEVRRLLDEATVPRVAVDLTRLRLSLTDRQMRRERRWRHVALAFGALAAVLLLALGLRLEVRLEASQLVVRWGDQSAAQPPTYRPPNTAVPDGRAGMSELREELHVLSDLIHALKQDADDRDQGFADQLNLMQKQVHALQSQADQRWSATEQDVAALYLLTRKGRVQQ